MSKEKEIKTNAMRFLDKAKISYTTHYYENDGTCVDGITVASLLNEDPDIVYKTLVTKSNHNYFVFVIPVDKELDLKKCAKAVNEKSVEMLPLKDLLNTTGYVRGGCSPLGMKKIFKTTIHEACKQNENIIFSGGKIGIQIEMKVVDLLSFDYIQTGDIIRE